MGASANIFQQYLQPVRSVEDYGADLDKRALTGLQLEGQQRQNALAQLLVGAQADEARRKTETQNALTALYNNPAIQTPQQREAAMLAHPLLMDQGMAVQKARLGNEETQAKTAKEAATAKKTEDETRASQLGRAVQHIGSMQTPEQAIASINADQTLGMQEKTQMLRSIPQDPAGFNQWRANLVLKMATPQQQAEALLPKMTNAGGALVNTNPLAGPMGQGQPNAIPITQSADNAATQATSRANNAATQAGENNRAELLRRTQLLTHGLNPDGTPSADMSALVDQIGQYQVKPPSGMALNNPRMANIMAAVSAKYPGFDATQFDQRQKAARDFGTGKQGQTAQSLNVAIDHLDTLQQAADALNNRDTQLFNKVSNYIATQTGAPAPSNFDATKRIVADEIVKAIVGTGGGVSDREEAAKTIMSASSPAQLKGVIGQYKALMAGQLHGLRNTYERTTGYKDFDQKFLTDRAAPAANGMPSMSAIDAELARRAGKK